jgi:hypothetical protein
VLRAAQVAKIQQKGGLEGLAGLLQTDLKNGLDTSREPNNFHERQEWFSLSLEQRFKKLYFPFF